IMSMGRGYHCVSEVNLHEETVKNDAPAPVVTSAGALVKGLQALGAKKLALIMPYMKPLAEKVVDYLEHQGFEILDYIALEIPDNLEVAAQNPLNLLEVAKRINLTGVDVLVASACVQMPSLQAIDLLETQTGIPVTSAAVCTTWEMLRKLNLDTRIPMGGRLLSGGY
ncbi:MAG TPA: hypothetical protein PK509_16250, partial [Catalimonadaceae bacterium]|nr:hypothetical protein [Catalimonadaceae bacterium]